MEKNTINIELVIATTGEEFLCEEVPLSMTGKEFLNKICDQLMSPGLGMAWKLLLDSQIINENLRFSEITKGKTDVKLQLIAKVSGG